MARSVKGLWFVGLVCSTVHRAAAQSRECPLSIMSFYQGNLSQAPSLNLLFTSNTTVIDEASQVGVNILFDLTWYLFTNRPSPKGTYIGMMLSPTYVADFTTLYNSTLAPLAAQKKLLGAWLGDEICWNGVTHAELAAAAQLVRDTWPDAIIYYNEAVPVITNDVDLWNEPLGYTDVPSAFDWFSVDYYRLDNSSWLYPQFVLYPQYIYPMMHSHQCALTVPGAYGSAANPAFTLAQYEAFMPAQARAYAAWAAADARMVGVNPWYFNAYASCEADPASCEYFEIGTAAMPPVAAEWAAVGAAIVNGSAHAAAARRGRMLLDAASAERLARSNMSDAQWAALNAITDDIRSGVYQHPRRPRPA